MGLNVISFPKKIVNGNIAQVSKWSAVHHPVIFELMRQDASVITAQRSFGDHRIIVQINAVLEGGVGDTIYINAGAFVGVAKIFSITVVGAVSTFKLDWITSISSTQVGGYVNFITARPNYYALINILNVTATNYYAVCGQSVNKPSAEGKLKVDVSEFLKTTVSYKDDFKYDLLNWPDVGAGGRFNIVYSENWTNRLGAFSGISTTLLYYYVNASKQVQDKLGSNMGQYVPFQNYSGLDEKAKFLSDFKNPTYFEGYPFSLGFIYSESIAGNHVKKYEERLNQNLQSVITNNFGLNASYRQRVNRLTLELTEYPSNIKKLNVWLECDPDAIAYDCYVESGYVDNGYVECLTGLGEVIIDEDVIHIH